MDQVDKLRKQLDEEESSMLALREAGGGAEGDLYLAAAGAGGLSMSMSVSGGDEGARGYDGGEGWEEQGEWGRYRMGVSREPIEP